MTRWLFLWLSLLASQACAFSWSDLWQTKNQQAQHLMNQGHFASAEATFEQADWRASASYRAGHYKAAAKQFQSLHTADGYYNQGNALAHQGQYKEAIDAYDKALASNPTNQDAQYNRGIVRALLKKEQQKQKKQEQTQKDNQSKEKPDNQEQNKGQDKQPDASDKPLSSNKKEPQRDLSVDKNDAKQEAKEKKQPSKNQAPPAQGKPTPEKPESPHANAPQSAAEREKQQAKAQWLNLIPDDPGGLMREKFLRDYLRRQRGGS